MGKLDLRLYLVADLQTEQVPDAWFQQIVSAVFGGVTVVQLRAKKMTGRPFYEVALALKQRLDVLSIPLIINDRLDIAMAVDAAGVHVGQDDLPVSVVRRLWGPDKVVGVSTHSVAEAKAAYGAEADYLGAGAMFSTNTKAVTTTLALRDLTAIAASVPIPVVAIGGITAATAGIVMTSGCAGLAISSAIMGAEDANTAARAIRNCIQA